MSAPDRAALVDAIAAILRKGLCPALAAEEVAALLAAPEPSDEDVANELDLNNAILYEVAAKGNISNVALLVVRAVHKASKRARNK